MIFLSCFGDLCKIIYCTTAVKMCSFALGPEVLRLVEWEELSNRTQCAGGSAMQVSRVDRDE